MFSKSCAFLGLAVSIWCVALVGSSRAWQLPPAGPDNLNATASPAATAAPTSQPIMVFNDALTGQPYGRYVIHESVPVVGYSYQPVKERVYVPRTVTESRATTVAQYVPVYSYQPQLRNVRSWNPFAPPQQMWQYVPIVQYQPNYVQVNQPFTYVKYEEQEVTKMIPTLVTQSQNVQRFVDRPLAGTPGGGNTVASTNIYQQAALTAQANRNQSPYPTRPMGYTNAFGPYAYGYQPTSLVASTPAPYYVNPTTTAPVLPNSNMVANNSAPTAQPTNYVLPAVPINPSNSSYQTALAGYNGYPNNGYQQPYANVAARPVFPLQNLTSATGSLFKTSLFSANRGNPSYVASNTTATQPYLWGNSNSGLGFRPNTSPYATSQGWGMSAVNNSRDSMQGGMPATVLR